MKAHPIAAVNLLLLGLVVFGGGGAVAYVAMKRGKRVTPDAVTAKDGIVHVQPAQLARAAGVPLPIYALARMLRSEHGNDSDVVKVAVVWAARTKAKGEGVSVEALLLRGRRKQPDPRAPKGYRVVASASDGFFGAQWTGKYAATTLPPFEGDLALVQGTYDGRFPDPTDPDGPKGPRPGADQFDSPDAFKAQPGVKKTAAQVAADRVAAGKEKVLLPGVPERKVRFWRKRGVA